MSGFIVSSGLDLDSIFQLKPPAITDASGILIGSLLYDGIETDPSGLLVVSSTGFKIKKSMPIVTFVDLADRYRKKGQNTYAVSTGFKISNNSDLTTLFEWGGYVPSFNGVTLTNTGRKASIEVSGNYYAVDISCSQFYNGDLGGNSGLVSHNPYTFGCSTANLVFGVEITFIVKIYNGFFGNVQQRTEKITTSGLPKFNSVTLVSATGNNLKFSFTGQNYSKIDYFINFTTGNVDVSTIISSSSPSSTIDIPITNNDASFDIIFIPFNEFAENGQTTTKKIIYKSQIVQNTDFNTVLTQDTPPYLYSADFLIVGAGGSGGAGGSRGTGGRGGGGGGGGVGWI